MNCNSQHIREVIFICITISCLSTLYGCDSWKKTPPSLNAESLTAISTALKIPGPHTEALLELKTAFAHGDKAVQEDFKFTPISNTFRMTAYAAPVIPACKIRNTEFRYPIRGLPEWVQAEDTLPARSNINDEYGVSGVLGWARDGLDAYLAEVNGSVKLKFDDGSAMCLGWIRTNDYPYTSLGKMLVRDGHISADDIDLGAIRTFYNENPNLVQSYMLENDRAVFFEILQCDEWPKAASDITLYPYACVAVDPEVIS